MPEFFLRGFISSVRVKGKIMMKIKRIASVLLAVSLVLSNLTAVSVSAEGEGVEIRAAYTDRMNSDLVFWKADDSVTPAYTVTSDGEYTVELNMPEGTSVEQVGHFEVRIEGASDYELDVSLVGITVDGNDYSIDGIETTHDNAEDFVILHNEEGEDPYEDFIGASQITATVNISGLGEAEEPADNTETESEPEEKEEEEDTDKSEDTASDGPTLAFDGDDWSNYVDVFDDTDSNAFSLKSERDIVYQGASMKLSADLKSAPDYATDTETAMGIKLYAEKFGLKNFDGYTVNFYTRFNINLEGMLFDNSLYAYGEDSDGNMTTTMTKKISYSPTSNVNNYEKQVVTIPKDTDTTAIVIKVPINAAYSGDVLYMDNLSLLDSDANTLATLDTYNANAEISDKGDVIKQNKKLNTVDSKNVEKTSEKFPVAIVIVIVVAVVAVAAVVVILVIRAKKRFY